jgi:hypothetical protein
MRLKIDGWSEADVRAEIIDPLVRILGYDKESYFSLDREKSVEVLGAHKALDYSMTLFAENFWLIEAKRPSDALAFDRDALYQALRYAAHPEVNAALLVLCDGNKIEVFDREETLKAPILHIDRCHLDRDFDQLRALLSPWQAFFFERRRVIRLIDKTFDQEVHLGRLEEFRDAIDRRLIEKRARVLQNSRERVDHEASMHAYLQHFQTAGPAELVENDFFVSHSQPAMDAMADNLVEHARRQPIRVTYRIFPDRPRPANAAFWANALNYLARLDKCSIQNEPVPEYLAGSGRTGNAALTQLIPLLMTSFANEPARQTIVLYAAAARRMAKLGIVMDNRSRDIGELLHLVERATGAELTFQQAVSSVERHLLLLLDPLEVMATTQFVRRHTERTEFLLSAAQFELRALWEREIAALQKVPNYRALAEARCGGEVNETEASAIAYDSLGHKALCVLEQYPTWKAWTLQHHGKLVQDLAELGSWQARNWLGWDPNATHPPASDATLALRFFFGDKNIVRALREGYGWWGRL